MFLARCIGVSLSVFVLLYLALSLLVASGWRLFSRGIGSYPARHSETFLFLFRILPVVVSALITLTLTVPSFLLLEPRGTDEDLGTVPVTLAICFLGMTAWGICRAIATHLRASRTVSSWLSGATAVKPEADVPVFRTCQASPALTVAGLASPRVLVSETAYSVLTSHELDTALRHELAHVHSRDNWKKLVFRFLHFPGMSALESTWSEHAEMAADDEAVSNFDEALDLASALIKLSRFAPVQCAELTTGLLQSSPDSLTTRVRRLFQWNQPKRNASRQSAWIIALPTVAIALTGIALSYGAVLVQMHRVTEWLVR